MPNPVDLVEAQAMKLTPDERAELAERLWLSVQADTDAAPLDPAWEAEIARRMQQIDSGEVVCRPWAEVMTELRAKHG
ncbi:addiction module protein [Roseateles toxinivorans]|uniref:Putative addiction module component (TIGR02574 family) n=1 Tax=Roseateles toxinivorans TaxID=270368 RepID=A0A4R6QNJ6_9BURK|nr:addiction module protein [Roseateles toxinivorans]TDP71148.1 putative addiction module component (TIGR02574 family) [Roseateles toxinivorans]